MKFKPLIIIHKAKYQNFVISLPYHYSKMPSSTPPTLNTVPAATRIIAINEKVTGPAAQQLLQLSGLQNHPPPPSGFTILDNASGGGILPSLILSLTPLPPINHITAGDTSEAMLSYLRARFPSSTHPTLAVREINQTSLPYPAESFDFIFNNFGVFFHPADALTLSETLRALKDGGVAGFASWRKIAWWTEVALPALRAAYPDASALPESVVAFPAQGWTDGDAVAGKLEGAGFEGVRVEEFAFRPRVEAEEFAAAMAVLVKVVMGRVWGQEAGRFEEGVERVLLEYLRENWEDGVWDGEMVALVSVGRKG